MKKIIVILFATLISLISLNCYSKNELQTLSPELREVIQKKMVSIQNGMQNMIPAISSGNYKEVSAIAFKIEKNFIEEQKITAQQKYELKDKLPTKYGLIEQQFYDYAKMLREASQDHDSTLVSVYYSKLLGSCSSCHSQHATKQFPLFIQKPVKNK
ncbi:MAG: hypothetical protein KAH18_08680 [Psychromonas sp.]|nr:hypothetical protein [Psychromonas sp.]